MSTLFARTGIAALVMFGAIAATAPFAAARNIASVDQVRYDPHHARVCSPVLAVQKARARGMRGAEISNMTPRRVVVSGHMRHGFYRMVFANVPGCPIIHR